MISRWWVVVLLLAVMSLVACGGGATSEGIGNPGGGGGSTNADLSGLTLDCGESVSNCANIMLITPPGTAPPPPGFLSGAVIIDETLVDYSSLQSALVETVTVTPAAFSGGATIEVNDAPVASGQASDPIPLAPGETVIVIRVTAANQIATRTYTITVTRLSPDNADLASLVLSGGSLSPDFDRDVTEYTSIAEFGLDGSVRVTAATVESAAAIEINGQPVASGAQSAPIPLVVGTNDPIEVRVIALSGAEKVYRITVTQLGSANLSSLSVIGLTDDVPPQEVSMSLAPTFSPNVSQYGSRAENRIVAVELVPVATAPGAVIRIGDVELESGERSQPIPLELIGEGQDNFNRITIGVSHEASGSDEPFTRNYSVNVTRQEPPLFEPEAYLKPGLEGQGFAFGASVAMSADGHTVAVGAPGQAAGRGSVTVFIRDGSAWVEQSRLDGPAAGVAGAFGFSVALSPDGDHLAVGAPSEPREVEGDIIDGFGSVYLYRRVNAAWEPWVHFEPFNPGEEHRYGHTVALAAAGGELTVAVGAPFEASGSGGVFNAPLDEEAHVDIDAIGSGAVYVYACPIGAEPPCALQAFIKSPEPRNALQLQGANERFGESLTISSTGDQLAVGMPGESTNAIGINGVATDDLFESGAVYVYTREAATWDGTPVFIKAQVLRSGYQFGSVVALSADGHTLAAATPFHDGDYRGVDVFEGNPITATNSGGVHVFVHGDEGWSQQVFIKPSNTRPNFRFGSSLALSADGNRLVAGAPGENSLSTTIDGNQLLVGATRSGAGYVFAREMVTQDEEESPVWSQLAYIKAANSRAEIAFGTSIAMSADGEVFVAGAPVEGSDAVGVDMELPWPGGNAAPNRGAVYQFRAVEEIAAP